MLERLDATRLKTTPCARAGPLQRPKGGWRPTLAMKWFQRAQILKSMRAFSVRRLNKLPDRNGKSEHHVAYVGRTNNALFLSSCGIRGSGAFGLTLLEVVQSAQLSGRGPGNAGCCVRSNS